MKKNGFCRAHPDK